MSNKNFKFNCGHCGALTVSSILSLVSNSSVSSRVFLFLQCNACAMGNMLLVSLRGGTNATSFTQFSGNANKHVASYRVWPENEMNIPEELPDKVETVFIQAEEPETLKKPRCQTDSNCN